MVSEQHLHSPTLWEFFCAPASLLSTGLLRVPSTSWSSRSPDRFRPLFLELPSTSAGPLLPLGFYCRDVRRGGSPSGVRLPSVGHNVQEDTCLALAGWGRSGGSGRHPPGQAIGAALAPAHVPASHGEVRAETHHLHEQDEGDKYRGTWRHPDAAVRNAGRRRRWWALVLRRLHEKLAGTAWGSAPITDEEMAHLARDSWDLYEDVARHSLLPSPPMPAREGWRQWSQAHSSPPPTGGPV